jgi:hypothetical protein
MVYEYFVVLSINHKGNNYKAEMRILLLTLKLIKDDVSVPYARQRRK